MSDPEAPAPTGPYRRQLLRNTAATGVANGWTMVLTIVSVPLMLRGLGQVSFGLWVLLQTFSAITGWMSLADLGVGLATVRAVADAHSKDDAHVTGQTISSSLLTVGIIGLGCGLVLATVGGLVLPSLFNVPSSLVTAFRFALVAFSVQVVLELVGSMIGYCLDGLQRVDWSRALDAARRTLVMGVSIVVALSGGGIQGVAVAAAIAALVATVLGFVVLIRLAPGGLGRPERETARGLLHYGRRVWMLNSTGVVHRMMDRVVVGAVLGPSAVALVEIATQLMNGVTAVLGAVTNAVTGSAAWVRGREAHDHLRELLERSTKYTCLATLPLCALVAVLARPIITTWVGVRYDEAAGLAVLGLIYLATQAPVAAGTNLLLGVGKASTVLRPAAVAVVINLVLSIVFVRWFGVAGAFVATLISSLVLSPLLALAVAQEVHITIRRLLKVGVVPSIAPVVAAAVVGGAIRLATDSPQVATFVGLAVGGLAAALVAIRFSLRKEERHELMAVLPGR